MKDKKTTEGSPKGLQIELGINIPGTASGCVLPRAELLGLGHTGQTGIS